MRSLIVDDDYASRLKLKAMLFAYGDADAVPNGELALEMIEAAHAERVPYDLVTVDIQMPGMNGIDVFRRIRTWERRDGVRIQEEVRLLAVTARQEAHTVTECYESGCQYYLLKPVTKENLRSALEKMGFKDLG